MIRYTIVFDLPFMDSWSFYCVYVSEDSPEAALREFESLGCPNTFGEFYVVRSVEK